MTLNKQFKLLSIVTLLIAISVGFYFGLSDDRTAAVNPDNSSISTTEYTGDMIGAWTLGANVLLPSRFSGMGFSYVRNDTGFLYMMGGDMTGSGGNTPRNEVYNLRTNSWSVKAPMPGPMQYFGAPKLKDSLYTIAGMVNSFFTSACTNVRRYSIPQDAWVERAPVPAVNGWCESVGYQDSIIYAIGGCINGGSGAGSQVYVYNALNNTWRTGTPLPASKEGGALGVKGDTLVYVGGASDYFQAPTPTVYRGLISQSNRANITWTTGLDKPGLTRWRFDFHDWGCRGLILDMGGSTGFGLSTEVYVYSPGLNVWTLQPPSSISTSTMQSGSFALSGGVYKLVCASGLVLVAPYSIPQTQIFTDTLCLDTVGVIQPGVEIPNYYSLNQNYPNPFNPATMISYSIPKADNVKLVVYDIVGRVAVVLVNEFKPAGNYNVTFDASGLSSGVYFYRLLSGTFTETKKMALLR